MTDDQNPIDLRQRIGVFDDTAEIAEYLRENSRATDVPSTVQYFMAEAAESLDGMYSDMQMAADRIDSLLEIARAQHESLEDLLELVELLSPIEGPISRKAKLAIDVYKKAMGD